MRLIPKPIQPGETRLLRAKDGYWVEGMTDWGHFRLQWTQWTTPEHIGEVSRVVKINLPPLTDDMRARIARDARTVVGETVGYIFLDDEGNLVYRKLTGSIPADPWKRVVARIRSHGPGIPFFPFFQEQDNPPRGIYIIICLGRCHLEQPETTVALNIDGVVFSAKQVPEIAKWVIG